MHQNNEDLPSNNNTYPFTAPQQAKIAEALDIIDSKLKTSDVFTSPPAVKQFYQLQLAHELDEHFCCQILNHQNHQSIHITICFIAILCAKFNWSPC